jgi:hypothetical protein
MVKRARMNEAVLQRVDDCARVVADRDAALAVLVGEGGVTGLGAVPAGLLSWYEAHGR